MTAKLKLADVVTTLAGIMLLVGSLLNQFGLNRYYNAWHGLLVNDLIGTYLLGVVVAVVAVSASLGVLPGRFPWRAWATGAAFAVLLNAIFAAIALSSLLHALTGRQDPGLGVGLFLGIAGAVVLLVGVALAEVVPRLASPLAGRSGAPVADEGAQLAGGPHPDASFGAPAGAASEGASAAQSAQPGGWSTSFSPEPQPAPAPAAQVGDTPEREATPAAAPFTPFWAAVPTSRPIYRSDDPSAVLATLQPGTWYAAVAPHAHGLVVQLPTGETGVLVEVADIFRG